MADLWYVHTCLLNISYCVLLLPRDATAVKTARCHWKLWYVPKFTSASRGTPCDSTAFLFSIWQDVVFQHKKLKTYSSAEVAASQPSHGLKSLCKSNQDRLQAYQHLFYLLQTNPVYLARLIFALPQSRTTKFMESAILTLYNYASNQREEYLLLKLFKTALQQEIRSVRLSF